LTTLVSVFGTGAIKCHVGSNGLHTVISFHSFGVAIAGAGPLTACILFNSISRSLVSDAPLSYRHCGELQGIVGRQPRRQRCDRICRQWFTNCGFTSALASTAPVSPYVLYWREKQRRQHQ
jgi:hypothetical protein